MLTTMADKVQITFWGPDEWREEINRRAEKEFGAAAKVLYLLGAHLLLRRSDAAQLIDSFAKMDKLSKGALTGFKPGDPHPKFPDLPIGDALAAAIEEHKSAEIRPNQARKGRKAQGGG